MELRTGALSWWKCHWPDLKSAGLFQWNLFLNPLKPQHSNPNSYSLADPIYARWSKKQSEAFHMFLWHFFPSLKQNFIAYHSSKVSDCIFEIHQLWQSGFSRVYSNCCCSCSFEPEIIKIGQSSHKMYSNNIVNFQESTTILNARTKKVWKLIICTSYIYYMHV